jgi:transcriptional regulator with XRE-family HTH domain
LTLGDVLRKERQARNLSADAVAAALGVAVSEYEHIEQGQSPAEQWGPILARIAICLERPTSRLISESGRASDAQSGECGRRIQAARVQRGLTPTAVAEYAEISPADYARVEDGQSPIEQYGPLLLRFAEVVDLPVFNLFYPCGIAFDKLEDYP